VLAVSAQYRIFDGRQIQWAADLVEALPARSWTRLSCATGTKGERLYEWNCFALRPLDEGRQRWLLAPAAASRTATNGPTTWSRGPRRLA
jgi:hypothetical protein